MKEGAQEAWHYTHEGERIGPVSLAELRIKAKEGSLHPRLDMVWTPGMAEWKPAGEIEGLFERKAPADAPPVPAAAAATPDPYIPPSSNESGSVMTQTDGWPGLERRGFYLRCSILLLISNYGFAIAEMLLGETVPKQSLEIFGLLVLIIPFLLGVYFSLQRLANVGMSRWWYLGCLVPLLNLWICYRMYVCPPGYAYHKKMDRAGVFLAVLFWLSIVLLLLLVAAVVVLTMLDNPETRKILNEVMESSKQQPASGS
jgi:hypothetical protein